MLPKIPMIELKIREETYPIKYQEELLMAEETINENLKDQPSFFAYYAVLAELADEMLAEAKLALEITESELDAIVRGELTKAGAKVTETMIRGQIVLNENYLEAIANVNAAKKNFGILRAIKEAFNHRKDCLISLASNMRVQRDSEIYIGRAETKS